jgi:hypothetical protein
MKYLILLLFLLTACAEPTCPQPSQDPNKSEVLSTTTEPIRLLFGLEPNKLSTNVIRMNPGSIGEYYGNDRLDFSTTTDIDLTTNGLNGLDTGSLSNGDGVYIYVIYNYSTGNQGFIASQSIISSGVNLPSGYVIYRKMPFGFIYNAANWDGIPAFHLTNWPSPTVRFTDAESSGAWNALAAGSATTWTDVDLTPWVPDNARMVTLNIQIRYQSDGSTSSAYIRSATSQTTGVLVGSVDSSSHYINQTIDIRTTSVRRIQYQNVGSGARVYIYVLGYSNTEPD